jgi:transcriptional antiterminator RfaH
MQNWYLVHTKPRQEKNALKELENQEYIVYLPLIDVEKIIRGARKVVSEPLFARYLFICLDPEGSKSWAPIRSTKGVASLVRFGQRPAQVSNLIVNAVVDTLKSAPLVQQHNSGDLVEISAGPFRGLEAVFKIYDGDHRAIVLLSLLGKDISATLELSQLSKI